MTSNRIPLAVFSWPFKYGTFHDRKRRSKLGHKPSDFKPKYWGAQEFKPDCRGSPRNTSDFPDATYNGNDSEPEGVFEVTNEDANVVSEETDGAAVEEEKTWGSKRPGAGAKKKGIGRT